MKQKISLFCIGIFFLISFKGVTQINQQDSLALVDLYNSTNGPGWINHDKWLTTEPVSTWYGVTSVVNGRVKFLFLINNKLVGNIPSSLGNLSAITICKLNFNQLSGNIPSSIGNLPSGCDLSYNQLSGTVPSTVIKGGLHHNRFTFSGFEGVGVNGFSGTYFSQADLPLIKNGNVLSIAAGGTLSNNTYKWYNDTSLVSTKTGDSTFSMPGVGNYSVIVTNSIATRLTLYSINTINIQDSLALVDLYNSTNGPGWINSTNWLTTIPACNWYGVTARNNRVSQLQLLSDNLINSIPSSLGNLSNLISLQLDSNQLSGNIPSSLGNLFNVGTLSLMNNKLSGSIPVSLGNLAKLGGLLLGDNQFSGTIPASLGNLSNLGTLMLNDNQLSGTIPSSLGKPGNLVTLYLSGNQLSGSIPDSLCFLSKLTTLVLYDNQLSGSIPDSIEKLTKLSSLTLFNNHLSGAIPSLTKLPLFYLLLYDNAFTFDGMEDLPAAVYTTYSPQASIPLTRHENLLSVSAGGTLANDTFRLFKDGSLAKIQPGDSVFAITNSGGYYITITNRLAPQLTLYSDTVIIDINLADTTTTVTQNITGNSATDINAGTSKLVTLTPTGAANALTGNVTATVTIDTAVLNFKSQPYVQRHYDIVPAVNANNAEATVTLYFTQQDFDNFNTYVTANSLNIPLLPTAGVDNGNVRITQFHGTFTGSSAPANYTGTTVFITPDVVWDNAENWWTVTFPVTGFSGFFVSTANFVLPLSLLQFTGELQKDKIELTWTTTNEISTRQFTIERLDLTNTFISIGNVPAQSIPGTNAYSFIDTKPLEGNNFYRLKMIDKDGNFGYSYILPIKVARTLLQLSIYPNPVINIATVMLNSTAGGKYALKITDLSGRIIKTVNGRSIIGTNKIGVDLSTCPQGTYIMVLVDEENVKHILKLNKQ